jgi:hypothetical protein
MQWFGRCAIQPDHFKTYYQMATPFSMKIWRGTFGVGRWAFSDHYDMSMSASTTKSNHPS